MGRISPSRSMLPPCTSRRCNRHRRSVCLLPDKRESSAAACRTNSPAHRCTHCSRLRRERTRPPDIRRRRRGGYTTRSRPDRCTCCTRSPLSTLLCTHPFRHRRRSSASSNANGGFRRRRCCIRRLLSSSAPLPNSAFRSPDAQCSRRQRGAQRRGVFLPQRDARRASRAPHGGGMGGRRARQRALSRIVSPFPRGLPPPLASMYPTALARAHLAVLRDRLRAPRRRGSKWGRCSRSHHTGKLTMPAS